MRFVKFQRVHAENALESITQTVRIDDSAEHVWRAVGQNGQAAVREAPEGGLHLGEGFQPQVGIKERVALFFSAGKLERAARKAKRIPRYGPEIFVPVHERAQPGIFELFGTPELAQSSAVARKQRFAERSNGMGIEQSAVGVKDEHLNRRVHREYLGVLGWAAGGNRREKRFR